MRKIIWRAKRSIDFTIRGWNGLLLKTQNLWICEHFGINQVDATYPTDLKPYDITKWSVK
jgi:hypothetical protein